MRKRSIGLAVFAALLGTVAHAADCGLKQIASFDMQVTPSGTILIPVSLDGTPRVMMVDTGAPLGVLTAATVDDLGLKGRPMPPEYDFYSASGDKANKFVTLPSLKIGPEEATRTDFLIANWTGDMPTNFAGTIANDILKNFDVEIDFAANKFNLFSQDHCPGKVVYWSPGAYVDAGATINREGHIVVRMSLDGQDVDAIVDTGTSVTILNETDSRRVFGIDTASPGVEPIPGQKDAAGNPLYRYRFKSLTLGGIAMPNPAIVIMPDAIADRSRKELTAEKLQSYHGTDTVHSSQMILGMDVLRHLHIYIAYGEKKIYATAAAPAK